MKTDKKQMIVFNVIPIPMLTIGLVLLYITNLLEKSVGHSLLIDIIGTISIIFIVLYLLSTIGFMVNEMVYIVSAKLLVYGINTTDDYVKCVKIIRLLLKIGQKQRC